MKMPRFLKSEAASLLIGLSLRPDVFKLMSSWPLPEHWTEQETEEFFMAFNMHQTILDKEAVKRGHPLVSRAVNFKNVAMFLAVIMLKEAAYEAQQEELNKFKSVLEIELNPLATAILYAKPGDPGSQFKSPSSGNDLGASQ